MSIVCDFEGRYLVIYQGHMYTADLEALVCGRCGNDMRGDLLGHWVWYLCSCSSIAVALADDVNTCYCKPKNFYLN